MKRILLVVAIAFLASPLHSQDLGDLGGFLGGDVGGLLNIAAPRGDARGGNRGAAAPAPRGDGRGAPAAAAGVDRLAGLRDSFAKASLPLTAEQETALNSLLNTAVPAMRQALQSHILQLQKERSAAAPPGTAPASLISPDELLPELIRLNDQLVVKIATSPALSPEQQRFVKKALNDQIRQRGGFDALNLKMEEGGAPFSSEQLPQIQALFNEQDQARAQMLRDLKGQPADPAKLSQLERDTLAKVLRLLTPAQRAALSAPASKPQ